MTDYIHGTPKLTHDQVRRLRKQYHRLKEGGYRVQTFFKVQASNLGVCKGTIQNAVYRLSYKDVD